MYQINLSVTIEVEDYPTEELKDSVAQEIAKRLKSTYQGEYSTFKGGQIVPVKASDGYGF